METLVVSAYPACGKTYFYEKYKDKYKILDSDSSNFSWKERKRTEAELQEIKRQWNEESHLMSAEGYINQIKDDLIKERYFGDYEGCSINFDVISRLWDYKLNDSSNNIESIKECLNRASSFINKIKGLKLISPFLFTINQCEYICRPRLSLDVQTKWHHIQLEV